MKNTKITKKEVYGAMKAMIAEQDLSLIITREEENVEMSTAQVIEFLENELEILNRKHKGTTAKEKRRLAENENIKMAILEILEGLAEGTTATTSEILAELPANLSEDKLNTQRLTPILAKLAEEGKVEKTVEKRKNNYKMAKGE